MSTWLLLLFGCLIFSVGSVTTQNFRVPPGPWVNATKGQPWPLPCQVTSLDGFLILRPSAFAIEVTGETCDILDQAILRYNNIIAAEAQAAARASATEPPKHMRRDPLFKGSLTSLEVLLNKPCERLPYLNMKESYHLNVGNGSTRAYLVADSVWGILRGLETFSQLLTPSGDGSNLLVQSQMINDAPLLPHRGLLLDTSRHFLPVSDILLTLDAMSYNKLNVFHWHIVDDNSFPYQSRQFPNLSSRGAYHSSMVYTPTDIQVIIEHARLRGIRVIPEFDTPGHTRSWGQAYPELLTTCYENGKPDGTMGPMDPTEPTLLPFVRSLFAEIVGVFPDKYVHLGGDEVPFDCWASNPRIQEHMRQRNMSHDYSRLEEEYIQQLLNVTCSLDASAIVWQEVFDNGVQLEPDTVVHVWTGNQKDELAAITNAGFPALLSTCWYLDHIAGGGDWIKYYQCNPLAFPGTVRQKKLMLGGEACMWGEFVDRTNVHPRIWPRASAAAERLWSCNPTPFVSEAAKRLEEHACRMNRRGIPAQPPNGPGVCVF